MANYIPQGWVCSPRGKVKFNQHLRSIDIIIQRQVGKFHLQAMPREDLIQEGRIAAAYAMDTYVEDRGNMMGYIQTIVFNALAMVACECLAQRRTPHINVVERVAQYRGGRIVGIEEKWTKRPSMQMGLDGVVEDSMAHCVCDAEREMIDREGDDLFKPGSRVPDMKLRRAMSALALSADAKSLATLMLSRPPELAVMARNMTGSWGRVTHVAMGKYLGWENGRAYPAMTELLRFVKTRQRTEQ